MFNELFEQKKYTDLLAEFEKMTPTDFRKALIEFVKDQEKKNVDVYEVLHDELTGRQWKHFLWLDSSERESEYIMSKDTFTEEDDMNLKACDF